MEKIQIIIPVYQDREALERLLPSLIKQAWSPEQITVVDAGDPDPYPVDNEYGIQVLTPPPDQKGRARQMNYGVKHSSSRILFFVHADTLLPDDAQNKILKAMEQGKVGGGFSRRFDSPSRFLRVTCFLADLRAQFLGWYFGDQAIFCTREAFEKVGGFPDIHPFEDLDFCCKLKTQGSLTLLHPGVLSHPRRFTRQGPLRTTLHDLCLTLRHLFQKEGRVK